MNQIDFSLLIQPEETLVRDCRGLSGASTLIVKSNEHYIFRKAGVAEVGARLKKQVEWFQKHSAQYGRSPQMIAAPKLLRHQQLSGFYFYELESEANWVDCYRKWNLEFANEKDASTETKIDHQSKFSRDLNFNLFFQKILNFGKPQHFSGSAKKEIFDDYFDKNLFSKLEQFLANQPELKKLSSSQSLTIGQRTLKNPNDILQSRSLRLLLADMQEEEAQLGGHGDLTLSNMIWTSNGILFVDPNPNQSAYWLSQELSKILQSTWLRYEDILKRAQAKSPKEVEASDVGGDFSSQDFQYPTSMLTAGSGQNSELLNQITKEVLSFRREEWLRLHLAVHIIRMLPYLAKAKSPALKQFYFISLSLLQDLI